MGFHSLLILKVQMIIHEDYIKVIGRMLIS